MTTRQEEVGGGGVGPASATWRGGVGSGAGTTRAVGGRHRLASGGRGWRGGMEWPSTGDGGANVWALHPLCHGFKSGQSDSNEFEINLNPFKLSLIQTRPS
jgi:hypothetical protein